MKPYNSRKLSLKEYLVVSSLLFGLFFGAGNLIFPLHLGQLAGGKWIVATIGFFDYWCFIAFIISFGYFSDKI